MFACARSHWSELYSGFRIVPWQGQCSAIALAATLRRRDGNGPRGSVPPKARSVRGATRRITWWIRAVIIPALYILSCAALLSSAVADPSEGGRTDDGAARGAGIAVMSPDLVVEPWLTGCR